MSCCGSGMDVIETSPIVYKSTNCYKIALVGNTYVGKTTICKTYLGGPDGPTTPTCGTSFAVKRVYLDGEEVTYTIWDTAGQERYNSLLPMYIRDSDAILVVYSLNDLDSFCALGKWLTYVVDGSPDALIYLVGTKSDLVGSIVVTKQMINEAMSYPLFEINSFSIEDVNGIFEAIGDAFVARKRELT